MLFIPKNAYNSKVERSYMNQHLEAKNWLKNTRNPSALATNRFESTENALKFVEMLYETGAELVEVDQIFDESDRIQNEGGPYATALIVHLPDSPEMRTKLYEVFNQEAQEQGFDDFQDTDEKTVTLWWD